MHAIRFQKITIGILICAFSFLAPAYAHEEDGDEGTIAETVSAFRQYKDVSGLQIAVPTVVALPFEGDLIERPHFAVLGTGNDALEPYFFNDVRSSDEQPVSVTVSNISASAAQKMNDGIARTYAEFALPEGTQGTTKITLTSGAPISSSALTLLRDEYVALPTSIEIRARVNGTGARETIVLARTRMDAETVRFPETTAARWTITLTYSQPLRITELYLLQKNAVITRAPALRFLAQPGRAYRIYFDPDRYVAPPAGEAGNLTDNRDVLRIPRRPSQKNPLYRIADGDEDGVPDVRDNCVEVPNANQEDINENERGDLCDDFDKDNILNHLDNCPDYPNRNQRDTDGDKIGDACDGMESRITEKYPWIPWAGIGAAALVLITLFAITAKSLRKEK